MSVLSLLLFLVLVGVVLYLVNTYIPMDAKIKSILNIAVVVVVVVALLKAVGAWAYLGSLKL